MWKIQWLSDSQETFCRELTEFEWNCLYANSQTTGCCNCGLFVRLTAIITDLIALYFVCSVFKTFTKFMAVIALLGNFCRYRLLRFKKCRIGYLLRML